MQWDRTKTEEVCKGNRDAADFIDRIVAAAHFWDDLVDQDRDLAEEDIIRAAQAIMIDLPANPFYRMHFRHLSPLVRIAFTNWHLATRYERHGTEHDKLVAFILRSSYVDLIVMVAHLVGGPEWALCVADVVRHYTHREGFAGYLANLDRESSARAARQGAK